MENKIIDYINQTPENTNPSVLATLLGELKVPKPLTYDYMPEGYPSKSGFSIEWDGNTEGLVSISDMLYKVSDLTPLNDELLGATLIMSNGLNVSLISKHIHVVSEDVTIVGGGEVGVAIVRKDNAFAADIVDSGILFPQKGTYFIKAESAYIAKLSKQTIIPMAAEFLPATAATQGQLIIVVYNGNPSGTIFRADKTYSEIRAAVESGMSVVVHYKVNISAADYDVYYHTLTKDGYYQFYSFEEVAGDVSFKSIGISEKNGEMAIKKKISKLQIVTK